jgi:hypothetical protein
MATNTLGNLSLQSILEKDKLSIQNFPEWYSYLRTVLEHEKKLYVLERRLPEAPAATAPKADKDAYKKHFLKHLLPLPLRLTKMLTRSIMMMH